VLEGLDQTTATQVVHRFANVAHLGQFAGRKGLTIEQIADVIAFERDDVLKQLLEGPFLRKPRFGNKFGDRSRFSDGEWPVFYAAIGRATAQAESAHHYGRRAAGDDDARRPVHYSIIKCEFSGAVIDLRTKRLDWPDLVSDDYAFCIGLGKEAGDLQLEGFFSPSARNADGTTVPAFKRDALENPAIEATAKLTFSDGETLVEIAELA
jgi:hypothetical protein